jgi:hypothetical protein
VKTLPAEVDCYLEGITAIGLKGILLAIHEAGYYEMQLDFRGCERNVLVPIARAVIVFAGRADQ